MNIDSDDIMTAQRTYQSAIRKEASEIARLLSEAGVDSAVTTEIMFHVQQLRVDATWAGWYAGVDLR